MGTHESQTDYWRLMRLKESTGDSDKLMGTHESQRDYWRLLVTQETNGDSETQKDEWGLTRLKESHES